MNPFPTNFKLGEWQCPAEPAPDKSAVIGHSILRLLLKTGASGRPSSWPELLECATVSVETLNDGEEDTTNIGPQGVVCQIEIQIDISRLSV